MAITWDDSKDYSGSPSDAPGFWFGANAAVNDSTSPRVQLNPNIAAAGLGATITDLTVSAGSITPENRKISISMLSSPAGYGPIELTADAFYNGTYTYIPYEDNNEPTLLGQFSLSNIKATINGEEVPPGTGAYNTVSKLISGLRNCDYLYLQLSPGYSAPPLTAGAVITLTYGSWSFDEGVPSLEIVCFLSGSMITTETGSKAVEDLAVGDIVLTGPENNQKFKPVTWVGSGHVDVQPDLPSDRAGYPICIRKNALGENSPNADLYVTPEHTLYIKGHLVPARMLVNHRSICYAYDKPSYDYYHFETADHSIIYANNLATESYLDTGNRRHFQTIHPQQKGNILTFPTPKKWAKDACAPLAVTADFVQPLHQMLEERAKSLGFPSQKPAVTLTKDANFHLITDKGETLYPLRRVKDRLVFRLPEGVKMLHLRSRTSRPCDTLGPYVDDRRNLGVLVGEIELHQGGQVHAITHHLTEQHPGWDVVEHSPCRWTNGNALLPLHDPNLTRKYTILTIQLLAEGPYIEDLDQEKNISRRVAS